jgi:hypothetical protein
MPFLLDLKFLFIFWQFWGLDSGSHDKDDIFEADFIAFYFQR